MRLLSLGDSILDGLRGTEREGHSFLPLIFLPLKSFSKEMRSAIHFFRTDQLFKQVVEAASTAGGESKHKIRNKKSWEPPVDSSCRFLHV